MTLDPRRPKAEKVELGYDNTIVVTHQGVALSMTRYNWPDRESMGVGCEDRKLLTTPFRVDRTFFDRSSGRMILLRKDWMNNIITVEVYCSETLSHSNLA